MKGLKRGAGKYVGKKGKLEKMPTMHESVKEQLSEIKHVTEDKLSVAKEKLSDVKHVTQESLGTVKNLGTEQVGGVKKEAQDLKKIYAHKDLIYLKTDAIAIVIRKLGGLDEFLHMVDKLTREGHWLMHQEDIRNIPATFGIGLPSPYFGSFYYFQHRKYINK